MKKFSEWLESRTLLEYEQYVDDDGYAHDDEGNVSFVGRRYAPGTYGLHDLPNGYDVAGRGPSRKAVSRDLENAVRRALTRSDSKFLRSILGQIEDGMGLTDNQLAAVGRVLDKMNRPERPASRPPAVDVAPSVSDVGGTGQVQALEKALAVRDNDFLRAVLDVVRGGGQLSDDQKKATRHNFYKLGMKAAADLFR
jgi:hypothetical protein